MEQWATQNWSELDSSTVGTAQLAHVAGESILCHKRWRCSSSQITLEFLVLIICDFCNYTYSNFLMCSNVIIAPLNNASYQTADARMISWWFFSGITSDSPTRKFDTKLVAKHISMLETQQANGCLRGNTAAPEHDFKPTTTHCTGRHCWATAFKYQGSYR